MAHPPPHYYREADKLEQEEEEAKHDNMLNELNIDPMSSEAQVGAFEGEVVRGRGCVPHRSRWSLD